jgi:hypothetical protein
VNTKNRYPIENAIIKKETDIAVYGLNFLLPTVSANSGAEKNPSRGATESIVNTLLATRNVRISRLATDPMIASSRIFDCLSELLR